MILFAPWILERQRPCLTNISIPTTPHVTAGLVFLAKGRMQRAELAHLGKVVDSIWNAQLGLSLLSVPHPTTVLQSEPTLASCIPCFRPPVYCARDKDVPQVPSWVSSLLLAGFTQHSSVSVWSMFCQPPELS